MLWLIILNLSACTNYGPLKLSNESVEVNSRYLINFFDMCLFPGISTSWQPALRSRLNLHFPHISPSIAKEFW